MVSEVNKYILSVLGMFAYFSLFGAGQRLDGVLGYVAIFLIIIGPVFAIGYVSIQFYKGFQDSAK